jgi:hypothetical protein
LALHWSAGDAFVAVSTTRPAWPTTGNSSPGGCAQATLRTSFTMSHAVRRPRGRLRDSVGERANGPFRVVTGGRGRVAEGHEPAVPAADRSGGRASSEGRGPPRPVPVVERRRLSLVGGGFRWSVGDARRVGLSEGGSGDRCPGGVGGVSVGNRSARLDLLHRPGACRDRAITRLRSAAGGDRAARADGPDRLRPALPITGRPSRVGRNREPDRSTAAGSITPTGGDGFPRPGHPRTARRPVVVSRDAGPVVAARGGAPRRARRPTEGRCRRDRAGAGHGIGDPTAAGSGRAGAARRGRRRRHGGAHSRSARDPQACGVDAEPGVLRPATATLLDLGCPAVPVQLRRDPRRPPGASTRAGRFGVEPRRKPAARWRSATNARTARSTSSCSPRRCATIRRTPSPIWPITSTGCWSRRPVRARP